MPHSMWKVGWHPERFCCKGAWEIDGNSHGINVGEWKLILIQPCLSRLPSNIMQYKNVL